MELSVKGSNIPAYQGLLDSYFEMPIETEMLVPDYIAEVFKIIKCTVGHTVFQKSLISGKILIEGYHKVAVYYQTEGSNTICQLEQKLPFSKSFDYRGDVAGKHRITVIGNCEYLNCRAINQRRIDVRGSYSMTASVRSFVEAECVSFIDEQSIQQKLIDLSYVRYLSTLEKQFTTETEIEFFETPESVLYNFSGGRITSSEIVGEKLILKGEARSEIAYLSDRGTFIKESKVLPINQVVDIDVPTQDCIVCPSVTVTNCSILSAETGGHILSLTCCVSAAIYMECEQQVVGDAFAINSSYEADYRPVEILTDKEQVNTDLLLNIPAPVNDDLVAIADCFATLGAVKINHGEAENSVMGEITIHLICENNLGELYCFDNTGEYKIPCNLSVDDNLYLDIVPSVMGTACNLSGSEASVEVSLALGGIICKKTTFEALHEIRLTEETTEPIDAALCIYFAETGEEIFDIAKRYGASPTQIMSHNGLTDEVLKTKQRLIVPV